MYETKKCNVIRIGQLDLDAVEPSRQGVHSGDNAGTDIAKSNFG
jgi:hypothetical protein